MSQYNLSKYPEAQPDEEYEREFEIMELNPKLGDTILPLDTSTPKRRKLKVKKPNGKKHHTRFLQLQKRNLFQEMKYLLHQRKKRRYMKYF